MWGLSLDPSPLSPPSTIQSHPACGHRNSDKRRLANGRGESYNKITSLLSARLSASQNRLQTGCSISGPGLPGLAGGPMGRQSQLPRKVPLNFPCCLHTLPRPLWPHWPRPKPHRPVLEPAAPELCPRTCRGATHPGVQAPALFGLRAACSGPGPVDFLCPSADPAGASGGRGIEELPPLPSLC